MERIKFIVLGDKHIEFSPMQTMQETCKDWAMQALGISEQTFNASPRGYIEDGFIMFFQGQDYKPTTVTPRMLSTVVDEHKRIFGTKPSSYGNGCVVGEVGEDWPAINTYNIEDYI